VHEVLDRRSERHCVADDCIVPAPSQSDELRLIPQRTARIAKEYSWGNDRDICRARARLGRNDDDRHGTGIAGEPHAVSRKPTLDDGKRWGARRNPVKNDGGHGAIASCTTEGGRTQKRTEK
jgi:hypothetical protein